MKVKGVKEVFNDYKKISLLVAMDSCDFKCENEGLCPRGSCQNSELVKFDSVDIKNEELIDIFNKNELVKAIIFGALEPMLQFDEVYQFIKEFREADNSDILIYTGYYPYEIEKEIKQLKEFENIIVKFGRYSIHSESKFDSVLGVELASLNQWGEKIS